VRLGCVRALDATVNRMPVNLTRALRRAGYSFICDPAYGRPTDPAWIDFCKAILPVARSLGARAGAYLFCGCMPPSFVMNEHRL